MIDSVEIFKELPNDLIFNIITYLDECSVKKYEDRIMVYEPNHLILIKNLHRNCFKTDHCNVKSWREFNKNCMKVLYKKSNLHDFHMLLRELSITQYADFVELETVNMLHHMGLTYYAIINTIYTMNYPILSNSNKKLAYAIFWDYCKYYFMIHRRLCPIENSFLL
jgi:hypothetical protein